MAIEYKFNTWRLSGEQSEQWSDKAYKLLSYNNNSDQLNGFRIGQVLYFYHVKGMTAPQIRLAVGKGIPTNTIKGMIRGFKNTAGFDSKKAFITFHEMLQDEQERAVLDLMYNNN